MPHDTPRGRAGKRYPFGTVTAKLLESLADKFKQKQSDRMCISPGSRFYPCVAEVVNSVTGRVSIERLQLEAGGHPHLLIPQLELHIDWLPLFSQHVELKSVLVDGVELRIVMLQDGSITIGGVVLPEVEEEADVASSWEFGPGELNIINSTVSW